MSNSNPHQTTAHDCVTKLITRIASPLRPATVLNEKENIAIRSALSQWRRQIALSRAWVADKYPDPNSIPPALVLGMTELEEKINTLAFIAAHKALRIFLETTQLLAGHHVEVPAKTVPGQPHVMISNWAHAEAELRQRLEKQSDLERLGKGMELFRRLVIKNFYGTTITQIRAFVDALDLGVCRLSPHPLSECPRLKLLGRPEQQLLSDIADAARHLWTGFVDPAQLMARYQIQTTMGSLLAKERQSEIFELLNGTIAEALDCSCDIKLGGASNISPAIALYPMDTVKGWRFRFTVWMQYKVHSSSLMRFVLLTAPNQAPRSMHIWHRIRAIMIGGGYRHAAMLLTAAVLLNASHNIITGDFPGSDPVGDVRVALARPDLFVAEILETPLSSIVSVHIQLISLILTAMTTASSLLVGSYPGARSFVMFNSAAKLSPLSDLLKLALMFSTLAIIQCVFCLGMQTVSLGTAIITDTDISTFKDWSKSVAKNPSLVLFVLVQAAICTIHVLHFGTTLVVLILKRRFALPIMVWVAARCIWYAVGHRSVAYLPLEAANFIVAIGFALLGFLSLLEEFIRDPMRLEANRCLGIMSWDAALLAYKESEQRALEYGREDKELLDAMEASPFSGQGRFIDFYLKHLRVFEFLAYRGVA